MKKLLLSFLVMGITSMGYTQGETCDTAMDVTPGSYTATGPSTGEGASNVCSSIEGDDDATNANWYTYTPDSDVIVSIASCLGGQDTRLSIFEGGCETLNCVTYNDDACEMTPGGNAWASNVTFSATAETTYYIQWDDRWDEGTFDWSLTEIACELGTIDFIDNGCVDEDEDGTYGPSFSLVFNFTGNACLVNELTWAIDGGDPVVLDAQGNGFFISPGDTVLFGNDLAPDQTYVFSYNLNDGDISEEYTYLPGNCDDIVLGCMDQVACNYSSTADTEDGSCTYPGCLDSTALNYNVDAPCEDADLCLYLPVCGDVWTDLGGINGDYENNVDFTYTICPDNEGDVVTVNFTMFNLENTWDFLDIHNGNSAESVLLGSFTGDIEIGSFTSTDATGCLTFVFTTDGSGTRPGWEAQVSCDLAPECTPPVGVTIFDLTSNSAMAEWTSMDTTWQIEVVLSGDTLTGVNTFTNENPFSMEDLTPETSYDFYIFTDCGEGLFSEMVGPIMFTTLAVPPANDMCSGAFELTIGEECIPDTTANNFGATGSGIDPGCASYNGGEVWFSFVAPASGEVTIETSFANGITDSGMALYEGTCDTLSLIECNDDTNGLFAAISAEDLIEGNTYFVAAWEFGSDTEGYFGICAYETPATDCGVYTNGPWVDFNNTFGGAPVADADGVCPVNALGFGAWANEAYTVDGFVEGTEYTFNICEDFGAGSWAPELVIMDTLFNVIEGPIEDCSITWTAGAAGTYLIGINEVGVCGADSENTNTDNGAPTLTCTGAEVSCDTYTGGPYTDFNGTFGGAPVQADGVCPFNEITDFEVWANEAYTVDGFTAGVTYTFSMANGPGAGSWTPELTVMDTDFNIIEGPVTGTSITWVCAVDGTYLIGINESGVCGPESTNTGTDNGFPALTCDVIISVDEYENSMNIDVYPNPANDLLNFKVKGLTSNNSLVSIYSIQGKLVQSEELRLSNGNVETIDISSLANGVYMLQIANGNAIETRRIIIE